MSTPRIEIATLEYTEAIVALIESAYRGDSGLRGWTTETHLIDGQRTDDEEIVALLCAPNSHFFILLEGEELAACCLLERREDSAYFGMFAVSPLRQSRGYGGQMIAHAERYAAEQWQVDKMVMSVIKQREELLEWYIRKGYRNTGKTLPFPYGNPRAGIPKRDDLVFLVLEKAITPQGSPR